MGGHGLAYTWLDGTPRTVPIWFHSVVEAVVSATPPRTPRPAALRGQPAVAVAIDDHVSPTIFFTVAASRRLTRQRTSRIRVRLSGPT